MNLYGGDFVSILSPPFDVTITSGAVFVVDSSTGTAGAGRGKQMNGINET